MRSKRVRAVKRVEPAAAASDGHQVTAKEGQSSPPQKKVTRQATQLFYAKSRPSMTQGRQPTVTFNALKQAKRRGQHNCTGAARKASSAQQATNVEGIS